MRAVRTDSRIDRPIFLTAESRAVGVISGYKECTSRIPFELPDPLQSGASKMGSGLFGKV
jgi:hypothetical protein